ncbi:TM0106 family RecB-like putative nuclease [soil metagenome]
MHLIDGQLVLSPTDLTKHLACPHITTLDLQALGAQAAPVPPDDALALVLARGLSHERAFLDTLRAQGLRVVEIETAYDGPGRRAAERRTVEAMRSGADVVYRATFFEEAWGGQADFLLRTDVESELGDWSYDVADTKLARSLKVPALLQMATYADRLAVLQGTEPEHLYVVTGDGVRRPWRLIDVAAFARRARARLREAVDTRPVTEPAPVQHCAQCRWSTRCTQQWVHDDDLSLVAFMRADHRVALIQAGISTVAELAAADPEQLPIGRSSRERLVEQARLQVSERSTGAPSYQLLAPEDRLGLCRLPELDPGDVYLDFEGDPYAEDGEGREYLSGIGDRSGFRTLWAHSRDEERALTEALVDLLLQRWREHPGMHVYHYAPYETAAIKRLTGRYGVREAELDQLLRGERFVDLYAVVRQGLRISKPSYSIKSLEAFYWGAVRGGGDVTGGDVSGGMESVVAYERWLVDRDGDTLGQIEAYNRLDVESTAALHRWLEERRDEAAGLHGPLTRPSEVQTEPKPLSAEEIAENDLTDRLRAAGHPLLGALVQWHRREMRPAWWGIFRLQDMTDDELERDTSAIGGLSSPEPYGVDKRSTLWRYTFPPQDTKVGTGALDVDTAKALGTVFELNAADGWLMLKVGPNKDAPRPRGIAPGGPPDDRVLRQSIAFVAEAALAGRSSPGRRLLDGAVPAGPPLLRGETPQQAVVRVGRTLSDEVLAVQGPPGSGKTTVAAELIRALLDDGKRVGITATSHAVIGHLLSAVGRPALQRCGPGDFCGAPGVAIAKDNPAVLAALVSGDARLVGGTAWLWARADMRDAVDVLVVDEAGQFSLANAVAVAQAASSLVLLGDPQQLTQPTQAQHPDGADASAHGHLLAGHDTVPPERGIFLDTSWRMHPAITAFVSDLAYEGRLRSAPGRERQRITARGRLDGSGLRLVPVEHAGNAAGSAEEVAGVARRVDDLLGGQWTDRDGSWHPLELAQILVVAPYNNQVGRLRGALPTGDRAGTVDKFQGQEAPVVLYSMASSSAEDAPRGVSFLYDLHRLNVAVSRAQAMAVIIASPRLLDAAVHSPEQLRKVNALCRYAEQATQV